MDKFRTMESFVRVVRAGSFTTAASQLGLSRALISRHVSDLEARLGVRLMNRSTRSLSLTDEGAAYLEFCEKVFNEIETNERAMAHAKLEPTGTLKVLAPKSFGNEHLSDAVIAFAKAQPRLRLSLILENTPYRGSYDFAERGIDLVLCFSMMRGSSLSEQEIATMEWVMCASPDYLARAGMPHQPTDLSEHACLVHLDTAPNDTMWRFEGPKGPVQVKVRGAFFSNSAAALAKAAAAGIGIAVIPGYAVRDQIAAGTVETILPRYRVAPRPLLAVYPRTPSVPRKVQVFIDFLKAWLVERDLDRMAAGRAAE